MGKDLNGKFVPPKGKPSGEGNSKAGLKPVNNWENLEEQLEKEEIYTDGGDNPSPEIKMRHPNRNVDKEEGDNVAYS